MLSVARLKKSQNLLADRRTGDRPATLRDQCRNFHKFPQFSIYECKQLLVISLNHSLSDFLKKMHFKAKNMDKSSIESWFPAAQLPAPILLHSLCVQHLICQKKQICNILPAKIQTFGFYLLTFQSFSALMPGFRSFQAYLCFTLSIPSSLFSLLSSKKWNSAIISWITIRRLTLE